MTVLKRLSPFLTFCVWLSAVQRAHGQAASADEQVIRALMAQSTQAFNDHDAKAWAQLCTPDARLVTVRGESMSGIAQIEKGLATIFATRGRKATLTTLDVTVRFIKPDVALVHLTNQMSGVTSAAGELQPPHTELSIRVVVKENASWRIAAFHNTIVQK